MRFTRGCTCQVLRAVRGAGQVLPEPLPPPCFVPVHPTTRGHHWGQSSLSTVINTTYSMWPGSNSVPRLGVPLGPQQSVLGREELTTTCDLHPRPLSPPDAGGRGAPARPRKLTSNNQRTAPHRPLSVNATCRKLTAPRPVRGRKEGERPNQQPSAFWLPSQDSHTGLGLQPLAGRKAQGKHPKPPLPEPSLNIW